MLAPFGLPLPHPFAVLLLLAGGSLLVALLGSHQFPTREDYSIAKELQFAHAVWMRGLRHDGEAAAKAA